MKKNLKILISLPFAISLRNIMSSSFNSKKNGNKYIIITSFSKETVKFLKHKFKKFDFYNYPILINLQKIIFGIYRLFNI